MASLPNPANIRYGGFYLPLFSLLYVHQSIGLPVDISLHGFRFFIDENNFPVIFILTFLGALVGHGASRSIYGVEGARANPKNRWVVLWYRILFTIKRTPGKPPRDLDHFIKKLVRISELFQNKTLLGKVVVLIRGIFRFLLIWPAKIVFLSVALFTTYILATTAFGGDLQISGGLLLVAQTVFFFGKWIFSRFPTTVPVESARWIYLAEYHKPKYLSEQGDIKFEHSSDFFESVQNELNIFRRDLRNAPHYDNKEDVDWKVPLDESEPQYLVELDQNREED